MVSTRRAARPRLNAPHRIAVCIMLRLLQAVSVLATLVQAYTLAILRQNQKQRKRAMSLLPNHIAVITGAGSGIGRAIALGYAREGARVVLLDRDEKAAAEAAKEIRDTGAKAESFALDVANR